MQGILLTTGVTVCTTCSNVYNLRFVCTLYLCVQLYSCHQQGRTFTCHPAFRLVRTFTSCILRGWAYRWMRRGHTVHCCLQLCAAVYNYSTSFTVLGLACAVMDLCRTYNVYICVDFVNFSRHTNTRNLHPVAVSCNWRLKNNLLYTVCG